MPLKRLFSIFSILFVLMTSAWAESLIKANPISGVVYEVENPQGCDRLFVFRTISDAVFEVINKDLPATWTELATDAQSSGTSFNPEAGYCYQVVQGDKKESFAVIDYSDYRLISKKDSVKVVMNCNNTLISIPNIAMPYYTDSLNIGTQKYDIKATWPAKLLMIYNNQQWKEKDWETVEKTDSVKWDNETMTFDSILVDTKFTFVETLLSETFYGEADSVTTEEKTSIAVANHQLYYIAKRGKTLENEKEGPYDDNTINHSAPLDVLFESHPSANADVYSWTIKRGSDIRTQRNDKDIRYTFDEASESGPITYTVDLVVRNSEHPECVSTAQDTITLNASFILVPNVFTPNGDGVNDEFRVAYRSICEFHCWVYNRWQHLVYQWDDPTKGWDGTINGRKEPDSAFIYIIQATGCDGKKYKLKGTVNLLRGE